MIGIKRRFRFFLHRVSPADPLVECTGVGTVIDVGTDHDGRCLDSTWCRLRVTDGPTYKPGEIILCRTFETGTP